MRIDFICSPNMNFKDIVPKHWHVDMHPHNTNMTIYQHWSSDIITTNKNFLIHTKNGVYHGWDDLGVDKEEICIDITYGDANVIFLSKEEIKEQYPEYFL